MRVTPGARRTFSIRQSRTAQGHLDVVEIQNEIERGLRSADARFRIVFGLLRLINRSTPHDSVPSRRRVGNSLGSLGLRWFYCFVMER
jgi:hypothetical protein